MSEILEKRRRRKTAKIDKTICWSKDMTSRLISTVEEYPVIWDLRCREYRDLTNRIAAWKRIEATFDREIPAEQLKKKWQLLCQTHSKKLAESSKMRSGREANKTITWEHWRSMDFMRQAKKICQAACASELAMPQSPQSQQSPLSSESADHFQAVQNLFDETMLGLNESTSSMPKVQWHGNEFASQRTRTHLPQALPPSDMEENSVHMETLTAIQSSMETLQSAVTKLQCADKYDEFGHYISSILRQMPMDFVDKAMAELQFFVAKLHHEAAILRLQRARENHTALD